MIILRYNVLFLHKYICCGYSLEVPWQGTSNEYPQHMFLWRNKKNIRTFWQNYHQIFVLNKSSEILLLYVVYNQHAMVKRNLMLNFDFQ